jgi:hypothetical protein
MLPQSYNHNSRGFVSCKSIVLTSFTQKENKRQRTMLVDYNKSLIITFNEYANVLCQKTVDKELTKESKKKKKKRRGRIRGLNMLLIPLP